MRNQELKREVGASLMLTIMLMVLAAVLFIAPAVLIMYLTGTLAVIVPVLLSMITCAIIAALFKLIIGA